MSKVLSSVLATLALAAGTAQATTVRLDGSETNLQQIIDGFTVGGTSSTNVLSDQYDLDQAWQVNSLNGFGTSTILLELAGFANSNILGLYDLGNTSNRLQLFSGSAGAGAATIFNVDEDGHVYQNFVDTGVVFSSNLFGFYLQTPNNTWFSQSSLNSDEGDHMVAYQGEGDVLQTPLGKRNFNSDYFLLAWEDLSTAAWDQDYNDMVVLVRDVDGVRVPEPATLGLLAMGLAGLGVFGRRRRKE